MSTLLDITQEILEQEVTGMDEFICIIGAEICGHINAGDNELDQKLDRLMHLINIRDSLAFYSVDSNFLTQDNMRYLINQAKKISNKIELTDNSIYQ